jgi:hypothetical protein
MFDFAKGFRKAFGIAGRFTHRPQLARRKTLLRLEQLEDRLVPTIVFEPHYGAENAYYSSGGPVLGDTPVNLLFWGSYWNSSAGSASEKGLVSAITNEFNSPIYNSLSQYGDNQGHTAGPAYVSKSWTATEVQDPSVDPTSGFKSFTDAQIQSVVTDAINDPSSPILSPGNLEAQNGGHAPIYLVITPPDFVWIPPGGVPKDPTTGQLDYPGGVHKDYFANTYWANNENIIYGWVNYWNTVDVTTKVTSHEIAEAITDPLVTTGPLSWQAQPSASGPYGSEPDEIGDFEAESYTYRINGSLTQALWDQNAQAFTVSDGTHQNFYVYPQYNASNDYIGNELYIAGDQLGSNYNDSITLGTTSGGAETVTLNGETATFEPGQITSVVVNTGGGNNTVDINSTLASAPVTINGGSGNNSFVLTPASDFLDNIQGAVTINGGTGTSTLTVDDQNDPFNGDTYTIGVGSIQRTAEALISYNGVSSVTISGSSTANITYDINSTSSSTPLTINAGNGANSFVLTPASGFLDNIQGAVTLHGGTGTNTLTVDDQNDPFGGDTYTIGIGSIQRTAEALISYSGVSSVTINGSSTVAITYNINTTAAGTPVAINGGSGANVFNLTPTSENLNNLAGAVTINAGSASTVNVDDQLNAAAATYTVTATKVSRSGFGGLTYAGLGALVLNGGSLADTYNIQSTAAGSIVTVHGGIGNDKFNLGSGNSLNGIQGAVSINGGGGSNTLNAVDSSSASGQSYTLSSTQLTRSGIAAISYASLSTIKLTGSGNDTLTLLSPVPTVATTFNGGSGTNTLVGANVSNSWTISGANKGKLDSVSFSNVQKLVGGTGVDVFKLSTSGTVLSINGGGAPLHQGDWLNYSGFGSTTTVTVNLATGSATNVNGGAAGAVTNIQNVIGSASGTNNLTGNSLGNILIGGSGLNTLTGGSGNSLLIGGSGHGTITGGSGTDILIAGTTTYSATSASGQTSLMAILAELQSADTFTQKVSDLLNGNKSGGGSDLNGTDKLTWDGSSPTVKASTGAFTLSGDTSASSAADWFFSNASSTVKDFNDDGVKDEHNNNAIGTF